MKTEDAVYLKSSRVRNTLPGTEGTYHDTVASIDLCDLDTFAERAGRKCGYEAAIVKNVIGAVGAEAQEIISTRLYRVHAPGMTFEAAISGSVPSIDAPLTEDNKVYVAIRPASDLKNVADDIVPIRSESGADVSLDRVQDEASGKLGVIVGTQTFILTGWGLSTSGEGEGVTVESLVDGTKAVASVSRNDHGQSVWAALDRALPVGKATVSVLTRGMASDDEAPWPVRKTVTILAGEEPPVPPTPTGPTVTAINDGTFHAGGGNVVTGVGMRFADAFPGNHLVIRDSEGTDMEAMISTDDTMPVTETCFALNIDEATPLTDGAQYVFEFTMLDEGGQPVTVTQTARWQS